MSADGNLPKIQQLECFQIQVTSFVIRPSFCARKNDSVNDSRLTNNNITVTQKLHDSTIKQLHQLTPSANANITYCYLCVDNHKLSSGAYASDV